MNLFSMPKKIGNWHHYGSDHRTINDLAPNIPNAIKTHMNGSMKSMRINPNF